MRSSKQRDLILEIINLSHNHLTAEQIYHEARKQIKDISLGTVYRNLNQLTDNNLVMRIKTNEGIDRYDSILTEHHHFICRKCNKVIDIYDKISLPKDIINRVKITDYEVKFVGICNDCLEEE